MPKKLVLFFLVVCSLLLAACVSRSSQAWTQYTPKTSPPASGQGAVAFIDSSNTAVLFGGITIEKWLDETWIWDGKTWQQASPKHFPPARAKLTMVYDTSRDKVVLFGGVMDKTLFGDTWEWDGQDWQAMNPVHQPPARCCHGMAYDRVNKNVIIYGGLDPIQNKFLNDAWAWNGKDWTEITCCNIPEMSGHVMVDFPPKDEVISVQTAGYGTWSWDGGEWKNLGIESPAHRSEGKIVYDSKNHLAVFFGGIANGQLLNDTWVFDGQMWSLLSANGPSPRFGHVMFYDPNRKAVILFGGIGEENTRFGDTWELRLPDDPLTIVETVTPSATAQPIEAPATVTPLPPPILLGDYELLSPEDMRSDLDELFHQIEATHPNPYTKRPKAEVDLERQRIYEELGQPMTMIDFYKKVEPLVASLGDYHTEVLLPENTRGLMASELFFPLEVEFDGQRWLITTNYSSNTDIPLGAELLTINGRALRDLALSDADFWFSLWSFYGSIPEYKIEVLPPGETTPATFNLPGMTAATMQNAVPSQTEPVVYTKIPDEPVGVLTINTFVGIGPLLKPAFTKIQEENVQRLIIDVRTNPGGRDIAPLMDYLTDQPYRLCSRSYQAPFGGYGSGDPREIECELIQPFDTAERFQGKLYLLIGQDTFSAAIIFATILQDYDLATLIGEETTDSASFCASASTIAPLPHTKLLYRFSTTCYVRPSGKLDDHGVIPDVIVETTIQDRLAGNDPVLDYVLELIQNGAPMP